MTAAQELDEPRVVTMARHGKTVQWIADATGQRRSAILKTCADHGLLIDTSTDRVHPVDRAVNGPLADSEKAAAKLERRIAGRPPAPPYSADELLALTDLTGKALTAQQRAHEAVNRLRDVLKATEAEREARAERERLKAEARAEVERLAAELAAAKARLRGGPSGKPSKPRTGRVVTPTKVDYPVEEVRAWAKANGHDARGRFLPKATVQAWREAAGKAAP
jgi:hypothetical protein